MTILILGATGLIGPSLIRRLNDRGQDVVGASRTGGGAGGVAIDRRDRSGLLALVRRRRIDRVVDLLAYTEADTTPLYAALDGFVTRWVMASSGDVYRNYDGLHRRGDVETILQPLTEDAPLRISRFPYRLSPPRPVEAPDAWMDDYDKIPLEAALRARSGLGSTIIRLPMIYGPRDRNRRFSWLIGPMAAQKPVILVDAQWALWRTTYGFIDDMADAIATAVVSDLGLGQTFNVGEASAPSHRTWIARFADALGWRGRVVETAGGTDPKLAALDLRFPLVTDTQVFRNVFGWQEPTAQQERLDRTIADELCRE